MIAFPLFAAAAMSVPDPNIQFSRAMLPAMPSANMLTDLLLAPAGRVGQCKVIVSGASSRENDRYCERAIGRDAGEPAIGPDGSPAYGMVPFDLIARAEGVSNARVPTRPADL